MLINTETTIMPNIRIRLTDKFMATGIKELINEKLSSKITSDILVFDSEHYYQVVSDIGESKTSIMFYSKTPPLYLPEIQNIHMIKDTVSINKMWVNLVKITSKKGLSNTRRRINLNNNEVMYIRFMLKEYSPRQIACILDINLKTIYSIRRSLIAKLECRSNLGLICLSKDSLFRQWFEKKHNNFMKN